VTDSQPLSLAERRQRQEAPLRHGAQSERQIRAKARAHKRRVLRRLGLHVADLDAIANEQLDLYARGRAKLEFDRRA
jgi:hypothetical protein